MFENVDERTMDAGVIGILLAHPRAFGSVELLKELQAFNIPHHGMKIILKLDLSMQSLKKIGKEMPKRVKNQFITSIKGHNSVLICRNLSIPITKTLHFNIISYTQFEENR